MKKSWGSLLFAALLCGCSGSDCEKPAAVRILKNLAEGKLAFFSSELMPGISSATSLAITTAVHTDKLELKVSAIRDRGSIGKGTACAALIAVGNPATGNPEFAAEYSVEPTNDGQIVVTARFSRK